MSKKPFVFVTRKIPDEAFSLLERHCRLEVWDEEETPVPQDVLADRIIKADGVYVLITDKIDRQLLARAERLKMISTMSVGYDHVDVQAATERGIIVAHTPGILTETTADLTFALLLATARRIPESERYLRAGNWKTWSPMQLTGMDIYGKTLGIIGMGRIGEAVARRASGFAMQVLYHNRSRKPEAEQSLSVRYAELHDLLRLADFVCVLTPLTSETRYLIGQQELSLMKKTAILINTSRGPTVDENALFHALQNGSIWAAGLDVYEQEPIANDHPLLTLDNVVAVPHIGSASIQTRTRMAVMAAENLVAGLLGQKPVHIINPDVLKS